MSQLRAILADSLREATDKRALIVLLVLEVIVILFCASIAFERRPPSEALRLQVSELGTFAHTRRGHVQSRATGISPRVVVVRPADGQDLLPEGFEGGLVVELETASFEQAQRLAQDWREFRAEVDHPPRAGRAGRQDRPLDMAGFLTERFRELGYEPVHVAQPSPRAARWLVALQAEDPAEVRGQHDLTLLFGAVRIPLPGISVAEVTTMIQLGLSQIFAGTIGMLIAIVVTASFLPNMLQKGTLDLLLARPISRARLLLAKYLGGLWFVLLLATFLVVGCWLALSVRVGHTSPAFLLTILTVVGQFAVLYSVSTLVGVRSRSSGLAALATLGVWFVSGGIADARHTLREAHVTTPDWLGQLLEVLYTVLPKTSDIGQLNNLFLAQAQLSPAARARASMLAPPPIDWWFSLGTTAAFAAVMLALAVWVFRRRDY